MQENPPIKRKPGKDLAPNQREYNRAHSRIRIRVENAIRRIKTFRIMKDRYRNRLGRYDVTVHLILFVKPSTFPLSVGD